MACGSAASSLQVRFMSERCKTVARMLQDDCKFVARLVYRVVEFRVELSVFIVCLCRFSDIRLAFCRYLIIFQLYST